MAKGTISDDHPLFVGTARSHALKTADVILLAGARLNWILHFGKPPRFRPDVKIIQIDNDPLEVHTNVKSAVVLNGDARVVLNQLNEEVKRTPLKFGSEEPWWKDLKGKIAKNISSTNELMFAKTNPMTYYNSLHIVQKHLPKEAFIVNEGANTMDIGRTIIKNYRP